MHERITQSLVLGALALGLITADAGAQESAVVVLRSGESLECESFASARNYSLCFQKDARLVTVNHAELWRVDAGPPSSNAFARSGKAPRDR